MTTEETARMREYLQKQPTSLLINIMSSDRDSIDMEIATLGPGATSVLLLLVQQEIDRRIPVPT
jgi:hypothetical protein